MENIKEMKEIEEIKQIEQIEQIKERKEIEDTGEYWRMVSSTSHTQYLALIHMLESQLSKERYNTV